MAETPFDGWCVVELMGHRRLGGKVSAVEFGGTQLLRVDVPGEGDTVAATQFYGASAIYCLTPCSEEAARAVAARNVVEPVSRWELPRLPARDGAHAAVDLGDDEDDLDEDEFDNFTGI